VTNCVKAPKTLIGPAIDAHLAATIDPKITAQIYEGSVDFNRAAARLTKLPWKAVAVTLAATFVLASIASLLLSQLILRSTATRPMRPTDRLSSETETDRVPHPSLTEAQLKQIYQRNIFNSEGPATDEKNPAEPQGNSNEITKSSLGLKLLGTIFGGDPYSGLAVILDPQKNTINSFLVNDLLTPTAKLIEVDREKVIIDNQGRREFIEVETPELVRDKRIKKKSPTEAPAEPGQEPKIAPIAVEPPPKSYKEDGFQRDGNAIVMSSTYRQRLLTVDMAKVLQDAKAMPNIVDNQLKGFRLTRIRQDSIYEKSGIQNDDVVLEINGIPLTDTSQAVRLLQSLKGENEIELRIDRGGKPMTLNLSVR
jgi:general secretion pathway protein C